MGEDTAAAAVGFLKKATKLPANEKPSIKEFIAQLKLKQVQGAGTGELIKETGQYASSSTTKGRTGCGNFFWLIIFWVLFPIAEIVIGALHLGKCPAIFLLDQYVLQAGVHGWVYGMVTIGNNFRERNCDPDKPPTIWEKIGKAHRTLLSMFLFAWFIMGTVFIFREQPCDMDLITVNSTNVNCVTTDPNFAGTDMYCHKLLYDWVWYETIIKWALVGFGILMSCCCCAAICACICCCKPKMPAADFDLEKK